MEDTLRHMLKELNKSKRASIIKACEDTLELLEDKAVMSAAQPYQLRSRCLIPLHLALESKNVKLGSIAIAGMHVSLDKIAFEHLLKDERFISTMESEKEEHWLPVQMLSAVENTASFPEEVQIDVMKMLLSMTHASAWCMNAPVIIRIANLCFDCISLTSKNSLRNHIVSTFLRILHLVTFKVSEKVMVESYTLNNLYSVRIAVKATFTQLLSMLTEKLVATECAARIERSSAMSDLTSNSGQSEAEALSQDVVLILQFICDKLGVPINNQSDPLLLEGILTIISKLPQSVTDSIQFHDLVWQKLCPSLISILANPLSDKSVGLLQRMEVSDEVGRGSGCSSTAPSLHSSSAKTINSIAVELVRTVGKFSSLRPVLESLFHRMLLYPPPVHRLDAIKSLRPLLSSTKGLLILAGPMVDDVSNRQQSSVKKKQGSELRLLKIIIDSFQECCHCNDSTVAIASVDLINDLLTSLEAFVKGQGIPADLGMDIINCRHQNGYPPDLVAACKNAIKEDLCDSSNHQIDQLKSQDEDECSNESVEVDHDTEQMIKSMPTTDIKLQDGPKSSDVDGNVIVSLSQGVNKEAASMYLKAVLTIVPLLADCQSPRAADELIQEFSSKFFTEIAAHKCSVTSDVILNADAVYITTYAVLQLGFKLLNSDYYVSKEKSLPYSEQQFVDEVLNTGLLLYMSRGWLVEVFHQIITTNILQEATYLADKTNNLATLLIDIDGLGSLKIGGQLLSAYQDTASVTEVFSADVHKENGGEATEKNQSSSELSVEPGMILAHKILVVSWHGILDVLSVLTSGRSACGISSSLALMFNAKEESRKAREAICTSLEGLQRAARLSCILGLQDRCDAVFAQLATASCVVELEDIKRERQQHQQLPDKKSGGGITSVLTAVSKPKLARLHAAHALSMDVLLSIGLEMGSHTADCWQHVFRCCGHISELEHTYFSQGNNQSSLPRLQQDHAAGQAPETLSASDDVDVPCADMFSSLSLSTEPVAPTINVSQLIHQSRIDAGWDSSISGGGVLNASQASKVLCGLSQEVDKLYEDAAHKLNMKALIGFLMALCAASQKQLSSSVSSTDRLDCTNLLPPQNALHLYRLGDVMSKVVRSDRPLLHIMRAWNIVSQHLIEAACHRDRSICKKAVACIHEIVTSMFSTYTELPHFHMNEGLCKPFESLLCLELCDGDVQDQIVCSICELVEASTSSIKSGWKPLFGALRAVKIEYTANEEVNAARQRHVAAVLDVFDAFLGTENILVFANAAIDCMLCLLKYVSGPRVFEAKDDDSSEDDDDEDVMFNGAQDLCLAALRYIKQCSQFIASMWQMPGCPVFSGAHRIRTDHCRPVDMVIPNMDLTAFNKPYMETRAAQRELTKKQSSDDVHSLSGISSSCSDKNDESISLPPDKLVTTANGTLEQNDIDQTVELQHQSADSEQKQEEVGTEENAPENNENIETSEPETAEPAAVNEDKKCADRVSRSLSSESPSEENLESLDNHTGALHVYFLVIEGLASTVSACPKNYQPQTLEVLFDLMRSIAQVPGPEFALYCVNMLLLPTLQSWIRHGSNITGYWNVTAITNCKQYTGLCVDLVVEYLIQFVNQGSLQSRVELMLRQQLSVLVECIAQPIEALSRLGCACIRHCLMNCGPILSEHMWQIAADAMHQAFQVTLFPLHQLMAPFQKNSENFYGDIGQVKVAVRLDCTVQECERLQQLAQQVFLLDSQRYSGNAANQLDSESAKSFVFLIYAPSASGIVDESSVTRIPFRNLVVGLLSHQVLVQTVGCLLLRGSNNLVSSERGMMTVSPSVSRKASSSAVHDEETNLMQEIPMPGMLGYMSSRNVYTFLRCLVDSSRVAFSFDARPGLKFLVQKVSRMDVAANMYKQAGISMTMYLHTLLEICSRQDNVCVQASKDMLAARTPNKEHNQNSSDVDDQDEIVDEDLVSVLKTSKAPLQAHMGTLICLLKDAFDEACSRYVDVYLEKEGPSISDRMSQSLLVFLLTQTEELPTLKREKSLKEMVAEKLQKKHVDLETAGRKDSSSTLDGSVETKDMSTRSRAQSVHLNVDSMAEVELADPLTPITVSHKHKTPVEDKVYTVAGDRTIKSLMSQYRRSKKVHTMPTKPLVTAPSNVRNSGSTTDEPDSSHGPTDKQIEEQQRSSIMKDSEAHLRSWVEMLCNALQLLDQLPDHQYHALLPTAFTCVRELISHCKDAQLRRALGQWTSRVGHLFGFTGPND